MNCGGFVIIPPLPCSLFFAALLSFQTTSIVCISTDDIISPRRHVSWNVQALGLFWCDTGCGAPLTEQQSSTLIGHLHRLSSPASVCSAASPNLALRKVEKKETVVVRKRNSCKSTLHFFLIKHIIKTHYSEWWWWVFLLLFTKTTCWQKHEKIPTNPYIYTIKYHYSF